MAALSLASAWACLTADEPAASFPRRPPDLAPCPATDPATQAPRVFPNETSCLRLIRALAIETHEEWIAATRYLSMAVLKEHRKELQLRGNTVAA